MFKKIIMEDNNCIETKFQALLNRFVHPNTLTPESVSLSFAYLFQQQKSVHLIKNTELHDTLLYLKDVMELNELYSLDDILAYYEKKKKALKTFLNSHFAEKDTNTELEILPDLTFCSYQKTKVASNETIDKLSSVIGHAGSCYSQSIACPSPVLASSPITCSFASLVSRTKVCNQQNIDSVKSCNDSLPENILSEIE